MRAVAAACAGLALWCSLGRIGVTGTEMVTRVGLLPPFWVPFTAALACYLLLRALRLTAAEASPLLGTAVLLLPWLPLPLPSVAMLWTGPLIWFVWALVLSAMLRSFITSPDRAPSASLAATRRLRLPAPLAPSAAPGAPALMPHARGFAANLWASSRASRVSASARLAVRAPLLAFTLALGVYAGSAKWLAPLMPDGDAPHYLIIAQSLIYDGDIQIEDNHRRGDYLAYSLHASQPDFLRRGRNGAIYSIHAPGLAVVIAPALWLFGYPGVVALLGIVAAVSTALVWWVSWHMTRDATAAWFGWAAAALTVPFVFQATQVFPDGLAATLLLLGTLPLWVDGSRSGGGAGARMWRPANDDGELVPHGDPSVRRAGMDGHALGLWMGAGLSLAILPWLQTRLAIVAVAAAGCLVLRRPGRRELTAFLVAPLLSAAGWFTFFYVVYGTPNPAAPYGSYTQTAFANIWRGLPGILIDQQFGLLTNAPIAALLIAGVVVAALRRRRWAVELLALGLPYVLAVSMYEHWWGGASVAARFLTPLSLVGGVAAARVWRETSPVYGRWMLAAALLFSVWIAVVLVVPQDGRLLINFRDGIALWLEWLNPTLALPRAVPSLFADTPRHAVTKATIWAFAWLSAGIAAWGLAGPAASRRAAAIEGGVASPEQAADDDDGRDLASLANTRLRGGEDPQRLAWLAVALIAPMVALTAVWRLDGVVPLTPARSQVRLLAETSGPDVGSRSPAIDSRAAEPAGSTGGLWQPLAVDFSRGVVRPGEWRARLRVRPDDLRPPPGGAALLSARDVPAGRYRLDAVGGVQVPDALTIKIGDTSLPLVTAWVGGAQPAAAIGSVAPPGRRSEVASTIDLPVAVQTLVVEGRANGRQAAAPIELAPLPSILRIPPWTAGARARRAVGYGAARVFFLDDNAFPEAAGFWVAGGRRAEVVVSANDASLGLLLRNAPVDNVLVLESDGRRQEVRLEPGEERTVTLALPDDAKTATVRLTSASGFQPSAREPGNRDFRFLGVWVEPVAGE